MKKNDLKNLFTKTYEELGALLTKKQNEVTKERLKLKKGDQKDVHLPNRLSKEIAQIMTILKIKRTEQELTRGKKDG